MAAYKKPTQTLRCGHIKATIWQVASEKGPFFATTFSRPFKDQSGAWRNGTSFGLYDLEETIAANGVCGDAALLRITLEQVIPP